MKDPEFSGITPEQLRQYLPLAYAWVVEKEQYILEKGVPLTASQISDAKLVGVAHAERVRLLRVNKIPLPEHPMLRTAAAKTKLITPDTPGLALRYGIFIRSSHWGERRVVVHGLAHTVQYERLGSVGAFLECFLFECVVIGYPSAPMEQEALKMERTICGPAQSLARPQPPASPVRTDIWPRVNKRPGR